MERHPDAPNLPPVPDLPYAEPPRRIAAYVVDVFILFVVMVVGVHFGVIRTLDMQPDLRPPSFLLWLWIFATMFAPTWLYFTLFESSRLQATPGKQLLDIVVTDMDTRPLSFRKALARNFVKLLPWELIHVSMVLIPPAGFNDAGAPVPGKLQFIGFTVSMFLVGSWLIALLLTPRAQSVHDVIVKTLVLKRARAAAR